MRKKPLIGLNADFRTAKKDAPSFSYIASGYYDCITAVGGVPVIIPPLTEADDMNRILKSRDRTKAGPTAPPQGLCLVRVSYEEPQ